MLTFLCILPILLFLISFSLVHTFLLLALHCIWFDNQLLFFNGYTSIWVHFNFAHCHEHLLFFNLLLKKNSVISCFNSFVVCCLIVQVFFFFSAHVCHDFFIYIYFLFSIGVRVSWRLAYRHYCCIFHCIDVCTYFCPFFPLACISTSFASFFHHLNFIIIVSCLQVFFFLCFCFVNFLCRFLYLQF